MTVGEIGNRSLMKAMVLFKTGDVGSEPLQWREVETPSPGPGEVRVRVRCCAVCRTDLHIIEGELPRQKLPVIPGHQVVGIVDQLGAGCTRFHIGQRIGIAWLRYTCGQCKYCRNNKENLCPHSRYTGYHADGGYAEYAVVNENYAYEIPPVFSDIQAAPLLCGGIIGYRSLRRSELPAGGKILLVGFGSSAHMVLQVAQAEGAQVYVVTRDESHQQLARQMGAVWVGGDAKDIPEKMDSAILFAPAGPLVLPTLEALDRGGTLSLAGIHMSPIPELDYDHFLFYERDIHPVTANTRQDGRELLERAARIPVRAKTTTYQLREANEALQDLKGDRIDGTGVLVMA